MFLKMFPGGVLPVFELDVSATRVVFFMLRNCFSEYVPMIIFYG